jgi:hypothetical protein
MPSRGRPDGLIRAIQSIQRCSPVGSYECLVRLDDDDGATLMAIHSFLALEGVRIVIGPKKHGYASVCEFVVELAAIADGQWCAMIDDDVTLEGDWATPLSKIPTTGVFVKTEHYRLELNTHLGIGRPEGWFCPTNCWQTVGYPVGGHKRLQHPVDVQLRHILVDDNGWEERVLPGTLYNHAHWMRGK